MSKHEAMKLSQFTLHHSLFAAGVVLYAQMEESAKLDEVIRKNLEGLGYGR
ncbi:MAG: hypothetical protein ACPGN3_13015 [Opitutales bacterium]